MRMALSGMKLVFLLSAVLQLGTSATAQDSSDPCASLPCAQGSTCHSLVQNGVMRFTCICPAWTTGPYCSQFQCPTTAVHPTNLYPATDDCHHYYQCSSSGTTLQTCPGNTVFSPTTLKCDYLYQTGCTDVNTCDISPCWNGGSCFDGPNTYTCICPFMYTGENCETLDVCANNPCVFGDCYTSSDPSGYSCECYPGYTGTICQSEIDHCLSVPCLHGTCTSSNNIAGTGSYTCACSKGWTGVNCSQRDYCFKVPCVYGSCSDVLGVSTYTCECTDGTMGHTCETRIDSCLSQPCQNMGTCTVSPISGHYYCDCPSPWSGVNCERPDACLSNPCMYGTCNNTGEGALTSYVCTCVPGTSGKNCQRTTDNCRTLPCQNGGTCTNNVPDLTTFTCACAVGFTGAHCESVHACYSNPCGHGGNCYDMGSSYTCKCYKGYSGMNCETATDPCSSNPCMNGASCSTYNISDMYYNCKCAPGYSGINCQNQDACSNHNCYYGSCVNDNNGTTYTCTCYDGATGRYCETNIADACESNPCENEGSCTSYLHYDGAGYYCDCPMGYTGVNCQNTDLCMPNPCMNGNCSTMDANDVLTGKNVHFYTCTCNAGYTGKNCSVNICQWANKSPCLNGGTCTTLDTAGSYCLCPPGYAGMYCEQIDACASNPCVYGYCYNNYGNYFCFCHHGSSGANCERKQDLCQSAPCKNGGTCRTDTFAQNYYCDCPETYYGKTCELPNRCTASTCSGHGLCYNINNGTVAAGCTCDDGFIGVHCEAEVTPPETSGTSF